MMKRYILFVLAVLLAAGAALAAPVSAERARRVAERFMGSVGAGNLKLSDASASLPYGHFYLFVAEGGGYVLVSADDCARPILAYSTNGRFDTRALPSNVRWRLESYEAELAALARQAAKGGVLHRTGAAQQEEVAAMWSRLEGATLSAPSHRKAVQPLVQTTWSQRDFYNAQCPYDSAFNDRTVTGCVATATAQLMKFWNHPATGYGSHSYHAYGDSSDYGDLSANFGATSYDWANMPTALSATSTPAQVDAVSTLMYHVGVGVEMCYGPAATGGSTAFNCNNNGAVYPSAQTALNAFFKYRPDMVVLSRDDWDDALYTLRLRNELAQQRPVLFAGSDFEGGHSFLLDGFDNEGLFHVNWGWGGVYDGYYAMGALNPGAGGTGGNATSTFNLNDVALLGVRPSAEWDEAGLTYVTASGSGVGGTVTGGGSYAFGATVSMSAVAAPGYRFNGWSDGSLVNPRQFIATGGSYAFEALFAPLAGDTLCYFPGGSMLGAFGMGEGETTCWGVRFPASLVSTGNNLSAVMLYVVDSGQYDLTVFTGANHENVAYTETVVFSREEAYQWQSIPLATPVPAAEDVWIMFCCSDVAYPAAATYMGADSNAFCFGEDFADYTASFGYNHMLKAVFSQGFSVQGDTLSYVGDRPFVTDIHIDGDAPFQWGIKIPALELAGRRYLSSVLLYSDRQEVCQMRVYRGGDTVPGTLLHSQEVFLQPSGWQSVALDATVPLQAGQNLWVVFTSRYAPVADYTGQVNSDWLSLDGYHWQHCSDLGVSLSWMVKCVTSYSLPPLPPPTVTVTGPQRVSIDERAVLHAVGTQGAAISWVVEGGFPAFATGDSVSVAFATEGLHCAVATISNVHGSTSDTFCVEVVDYHVGDTISYCRSAGRDTVLGIGTGSSLSFRWGIMLPAAYLAQRDSLREVQLFVSTPGTYHMTLCQGGDTVPGTVVFSNRYSFADSMAYFPCPLPSPLALDTTQNLWVTFEAPDVAYPASACAYTGDVNSDWVAVASGDGGWMHLVRQKPFSWMIRCVTTTGQPLRRYLVTVESSDTALGSVSGGGVFFDGDTALLSATPREGALFVRWGDGSTVRERRLVVHSSANYIAYFMPDVPPVYMVTAMSADPSKGSVEGGGSYEVGTTVTLTAIPAEGYRFSHWHDLDSHDVRTIVVEADVRYVAYFVSLTGVAQADGRQPSLALSPNPASTAVYVFAVEAPEARLSLMDLCGRTLLSVPLPPDGLLLPLVDIAPGTYLLRVTSENGSAVRKLIVK